jgi:hypothetical protein
LDEANVLALAVVLLLTFDKDWTETGVETTAFIVNDGE